MIPNNAEAHCQLATLLARQNKRAEAQAHFNEALRLRPGYAEALEGLRALASGAQAPGK